MAFWCPALAQGGGRNPMSDMRRREFITLLGGATDCVAKVAVQKL
jgi:hypothetical protein